MILTIFFSIALDTLPVQPIKTLLPHPVKSQTIKTKTNDKNKNHKIDDADSRVLGRVAHIVVAR
jgi:hypothetical protein